MILSTTALFSSENGITRTCGGDPDVDALADAYMKVLPAHAGVILNSFISSVSWVTYYPHMRG